MKAEALEETKKIVAALEEMIKKMGETIKQQQEQIEEIRNKETEEAETPEATVGRKRDRNGECIQLSSNDGLNRDGEQQWNGEQQWSNRGGGQQWSNRGGGQQWSNRGGGQQWSNRSRGQQWKNKHRQRGKEEGNILFLLTNKNWNIE